MIARVIVIEKWQEDYQFPRIVTEINIVTLKVSPNNMLHLEDTSNH